MRNFLIRSIIGIFFGAFIVVMVTNIGGKEFLDEEIFLKNSIGAIVCGWFFSVTRFYFEIKSLRLFQQTVLHFITVIILYFTLSVAIGWIPFNLESMFFALVLFIVIYALFWIGFYLHYKNEAKRLNDELKKI